MSPSYGYLDKWGRSLGAHHDYYMGEVLEVKIAADEAARSSGPTWLRHL